MKKIVLFLWNENVISLFLIVISFCVYLTTMCRSVGFTDSGELAAVVCTLGIAHPTGYPLFTLLGRCWIMLPFCGEEIIRLNIFSALLTSVAVGLFFKTTLAIMRAVKIFQPQTKRRTELNIRCFILASAIASLALGFSTTFWLQSTAFEVYALHLVMILLTIGTFISGLEEQLIELHIISRKLFLFAFVLGLSFSNHMTTILLAPAFLWLYFHIFGFGKGSFTRVLKIAPLFLLGLSVYLYLPIRSANNPLFDWGHPATLERFFWHVSGKQFRVWMFSGWGVMQKQLNYFVNNFTSEFHLFIILFLVIGIFALYKESRRLFIFLIILFAATLAYALNYDIFDIGSYFLLAYLAVGWVMVYGIDFVFNWAKDLQIWKRAIIIAVILAMPIVQIIFNREEADETKNKLPQQFVENTFAHLEPNAVVLASQWDYFISPSLYYQFIQKKRCDVTVIDKSLLQNRSWYFLQLAHHAPWLVDSIHPSMNKFLMELNKFEHDVPFNFNLIQVYWNNLLIEIIEKSFPYHPVYIDPRIDQEFPSIYHRTPAGLFLRLTKAEDALFYRTALTPFIWEKEQSVVKDLKRYYITMLLRETDWLLRHGKTCDVKTILTEILHVEPSNFEAIWLMKRLQKE